MERDHKLAAICISGIHEETLRNFIAAFNEKLCEHGWRVCILTSGTALYDKSTYNRGEETIFLLLDQIDIDAVVIFKDKLLDEECFAQICSSASAKGIPAYVINGKNESLPNLAFDFTLGFERVIRHLIEEHDVRDFHFIAGFRDNDFSDERKTVMSAVLAEYSIPFGEEQVSYGDFWSLPTINATERLIEEKRLPRAIVCANDSMAIAASVTLRKHGYSVPEDVIVTGFDGIDDIYFSMPKITSCRCDFAEMGRKTAELILSGHTAPGDILVAPELLPMESCGCKVKDHIDIADYIMSMNNAFNRFRNENDELSEISTKIQSCRTLDEVSELLHHRLFYCMSCIVKEEFIDESLDPMIRHSRTDFGEQAYVLSYSNDRQSPYNGKLFPVKQIIPGLNELFQDKQPIVLIALHQMELPIGYLVFQYDEPLLGNYLKVNQSAVFLSSALSSYRNIKYQQHLQETYRYDTLTGLLMRSAFLRQFEAMQRKKADTEQMLILCDLDGLKYINDHFSHRDGDRAIETVAVAMNEVCKDGLCGRYGGDEMIAVLWGEHDPTAVRKAILEKLEEYNRSSGLEYEVSASIGIYTAKNTDFDTMFSRADELMYQDKQRKKYRR